MDGLLYMLCQKKSKVLHGVMAAVSIWSMRRKGVWNGPVQISCGDGHSARVATAIAADERLGPIKVVPFQHDSKRNGAYQAKTNAQALSIFGRTIFIDADTTFTGGPIDKLWPTNDELVLTSFSDWQTQGKMMQGRIKKWTHIAPQWSAKCLTEKFPSINTGVFGFTRETRAMAAWRKLCLEQERIDGRAMFIADETAAQLTYPHFRHRIVNDRFNCSPRFGLNHTDARIWHYHGRKHVRDERGKKLWMPEFANALTQNAGGVCDWGRDHDPAAFQHFDEFCGVSEGVSNG